MKVEAVLEHGLAVLGAAVELAQLHLVSHLYNYIIQRKAN
jgi:hypothetical protein